MPTSMEMIVLSAPEREDLFAEIYADDRLWAFVERSATGLRLRIVSQYVEPIWEFDLTPTIEILQAAARSFQHTTLP
jgi:hypothetical protein